jgi:hypothetical protein
MILHNIAVKKRIALDNGSIESDGHYDVVRVDNNEEAATSMLNIEALCVERRLLEVEYLEALGKNINDSTLALCAECVRLLPQLTRMAEYHWNKLYNVTFRKNLSIAIAKELQEQYNLYKESKKKVENKIL